MDTEKPQVSLLAKELKEHGIACSIDEAEQKAQSIIMTTENKKTEEDEKIQLLEQRYKFMLHSQNQKFSEEINALKNTLASVSSELIELKRKFNEHKQEIKTNQEELKPEETQQKITETEEKKETKEVDLKNLKSEDVSIEKFFYFGKK